MKHPAYALLFLPLILIIAVLLYAWQQPGPADDFRLSTPGEKEGAPAEEAATHPFDGLGIELVETRTFVADTLADYINGAADAYIEAGFHTCTVWQGRKGETEVILERYAMATPDAASAICDREGGEFLMEEAMALPCGSNYIKATLFPADEEIMTALKEAVTSGGCS